MSGRPSSAFGHHAGVSSTPSMIPRRTSLGGSGIPTLSRSSGASGAATLGVLGQSGLPTPSSSNITSQPPSTAAVNRTLKRTSNQAGLPTPGPSAYKRSATPSLSTHTHTPGLPVPSTPSNKLTSLRHDLEATASATTLQRQLSSAQRENGQLMRELGAMQERVKQLEKERAILISREEKSLSKDSSREQEREAERRTLVASLGEFRQRYAVLEDENDILQSENNRIKHENELVVEEKNNAFKQMEVLQEELQKLDEENHKLRRYEDELKEAQERLSVMQKELQERPASSLSASTSNSADHSVTDVLRRELHHQVQHLRTLEQNNARLTKELAALKQDRANVELLKEEKLSLESKVRRMDTLRRTLADVEGEVAILKRERDEWAVFLRNSQQQDGEDASATNGNTERFETPAQLTRSLASAKIEIASLREKLETNASNLKLRGEIMSALEARVQELEQETVPFWKRETESFKRRLENIERMRNLDQKELGMLREQIQSYAIEESQLMASTSSRDGDVKPNLAAYDEQKTLQINHLTELLDAQKAETARLAEELEQLAEQLKDAQSSNALHTSSTDSTDHTAKQENVRNVLSEQLERNEELQEALRLAQMDLAELQNEAEALDAQVDALQFALGRGEYNTATTKVLSLKDNPADMDLAIRTETLDRLKEENRVLLEKLEEAEQAARFHAPVGHSDGHANAAPAPARAQTQDSTDIETVPKQTYLNLQAENEALQAKVEQGEKSRARLREVFQKTASQLRDACKSLLGYTVEPVENGRMKLTTVFGGSDFQLVFGPGSASDKASKGKLQLVGGNETFINSPRVQQGLHFWVAERGCLPGFLASMTLELFEESTRGRTVGYMEG